MTKQAEERVVLDVAVVEIVEEADVPDDPGDEDEDVEDEAGDHVVVSLLAAKKYLTETKKYFIPPVYVVRVPSGPARAGNVSEAFSCSVNRRVSVN